MLNLKYVRIHFIHEILNLYILIEQRKEYIYADEFYFMGILYKFYGDFSFFYLYSHKTTYKEKLQPYSFETDYYSITAIFYIMRTKLF